MVAIPALSRCTIPDSTNTSASWAIISPKKVILLEKTNIITRRSIRCKPRDKRRQQQADRHPAVHLRHVSLQAGTALHY
ncbi:Uncharacterised protein [Klebsiella pneumoniae]|uniref:Uncharacterized protein n=1 Tax=Klebsiella pneumoniae TaxID=573 RepID=A0A447S3U7_KLEPN|nr:Uncharacterised protein [Klebsiella pneumoniae]